MKPEDEKSFDRLGDHPQHYQHHHVDPTRRRNNGSNSRQTILALWLGGISVILSVLVVVGCVVYQRQGWFSSNHIDYFEHYHSRHHNHNHYPQHSHINLEQHQQQEQEIITSKDSIEDSMSDHILTGATHDVTGMLGGTFSLKHIYHHNTERRPQIHKRLDITNNWLKLAKQEAMLIKTQTDMSSDDINDTTVELESFPWDNQLAMHIAPKPKIIRRIVDQTPDTMEAYLEFTRTPMARQSGFIMDFDWKDHEVLIPDITSKDTVITLAYMSSDAYVDIPYTGDWTNVTDPWNNESSIGMGWQEDGVRGHVFTNADSSIAVLALKGTSAAIFDSGGDTAPNDKINDNLLFSCCCARISYLWNTVCDCFTGDSYTCNAECLEEQLYSEDRYYRAVLDIYRNVTALYPKATIWVTGHSLGGSLAALLGRTYGLPAIGFEAPPELLASKRLHLPQPPGIPPWEDHVWHFGHTADPVFMGVCNGAGSTCWIAGYAMETQCHSGLQCIYDVVEDLGWHVSMVNHRIHVVIDDVILKYNDTPACVVPPPCQDCFNWNFVFPSIPEFTTTATTTSTEIQTSTGKPTSTSTASDSVITSPAPSETNLPEKCVKRAWYGRCLEYGPDDGSDEPAVTN